MDDSIGSIIGDMLAGMPPEILREAVEHPATAEQREQRRADAYNSQKGDLGYIDCPDCLNRGDKAVVVDGVLKIQPCVCMIKRENMRRLHESGLADFVMDYTFAAYQTPDAEREGCKAKAMEYTRAGDGNWLFVSGRSGSGKTHLCTAVCAGLIRQCHDVRYMLWRDTAPRLKALINEREQYESEIAIYKTVDVLYIDDLFKGSVTSADVNLAYEIINARYAVRELRTIVSTERSIDDIIRIDEALGGRIFERSRDYMINAPNQNWRLRK